MRRLAVALALCLCGASCSLPAVRGRVVDRETRAPIAGALVVEEWRGGAVPSDAPSLVFVRFATTAEDGGFAFESTSAPGLGFTLRGARGPIYSFSHLDYGWFAGDLGPPAGAIELAGSRGNPAAGRALEALCETAPRGEWEREIQSRACVAHRR